MTHLQAGDRVVCVNAEPQSVQVGPAFFTVDCGLVKGGRYTVAEVFPVAQEMFPEASNPVLVRLEEVVCPLVALGAPDGYHPARFRKAISTGCSSTIEKLKRDLGVTEREGEPA